MDIAIDNETGFEIAVIGMAGRFPGANNLADFWENLKHGKESVKFFSDDELREYHIDEATLRNPDYVKAKGYLENIDQFDAAFFGYSPQEALRMDPQIRLFHECAWHALEDAGYYPEKWKGQIGMYGGGFTSGQWQATLFASLADDTLDWMSLELISNKDLLTTRVSYNLGLTGPSFSVNTQCSTSLVAIHLASSALIAGECDMALAGGVTINLPPKTGYTYAQDAIISQDGHCRPFDEKANGTIWGDGVGIVALKRLRSALRDGDNIYAVIKGSAINNDGASKSNFTAPSVSGQQHVIRLAQQFAEVDPATIEYVETHGTGTSLGDPIEIEALKRSFNTTKKGYCGIGSVKSNLGHLIAAAGIASFIKTVLTLKNKQIPPSINFDKPNPKIDFANSPFYVNTQLKDWHTREKVRRAAVSSFGIGGTNAHVILEEAPRRAETPAQPGERTNVFVLSAKSEGALADMIGQYQSLAADPSVRPDDVAFSLQTTRKPFKHRLAIPYTGRTDLVGQLQRAAGGEGLHAVRKLPYVVFMFPGQGSQYTGMCAELYASYDVFRQEFDACHQILGRSFGIDLNGLVFGPAAARINETQYAQLALFVTEYATAKLLTACGITPHALIGHSVGEYVAATLSGVLSLPDALGLIEARGRLMQALPPGAMLSVMAAAEDLEPYLGDGVSVAGVNSTGLLTLSGSVEAIGALSGRLRAGHVPFTRLNTGHAFHSAMVEPVLETFIERVRRVKLSPPAIPYLSNVTGTWITDEQATDPAYYGKHLRAAVLFEAGITALTRKGACLFIEAGPGNTLAGFVKRHRHFDAGHQLVNPCRHPSEATGDQVKWMQALAAAWRSGIDVNFLPLYGPGPRPARIRLPLYPFQKQQYWPAPAAAGAALRPAGHEAVRTGSKNTNDWFYDVSWQKTPAFGLKQAVSASALSWLCLVNDRPAAENLGRLLRGQHQRVVVAWPSDHFGRVAEGAYCLDYAREEHFAQLFAAEHAAGNPFDVVLNVLPYEAEPVGQATGEKVLRSFYSNVFVIRGHAAVSGARPLKLTTVANNSFLIAGNESLNPFHSLAIGTVKVISSEYPHIAARFIDTDCAADPGRAGAMLLQICRETLGDRNTKVVAYRNDIRWEQVIVKTAPSSPNLQSITIREQGVYVITGGLGIFGFKFSAYLQDHANVKLALLTRSRFPARSTWRRWGGYSLAEVLAFETLPAELGVPGGVLSAPERKDVHAKVQKLLKLLAAGADVHVYGVNLSDEADVAQCLNTVEAELGPVNGIMHGAGFYQYTPIADASRKMMDDILEPKVLGTIRLAGWIKERPLDFLMLQSSLSAVIPLKAFSAYSAANLFLDAFACHLKAAKGLRVISVNWDLFRLSEDEIGSVTEEEAQSSKMYIKFLKDGISHEQGKRLFDQLLHEEATQVVISRNDLLTVRNLIDAEGPATDPAAGAPPAARPTGKRPALGVAYAAPRSAAEQSVQEVWQDVLGYEQVGVLDNFFELGGNSLQALVIINRINKKYRLHLSISDFFKTTTIEALAAYLTQKEAQQEAASDGRIRPAAAREYYALSPAQQRLYFLFRMDPSSLAYNVPHLVELVGDVDREQVERTFKSLIARHESLRTSIRTVDGEPVQRVAADVPFQLECIEAEPGDVAAAVKAFIRPFDLGAAPLMRVGLIKTAPQHHVLLIDMHHIVTDGVTRAILIRDFTALFGGQALPALKLQYKDYAEWLREPAQQQRLAAQLPFWKSRFADGVTPLELPADYARPAVKSNAGRVHHFALTQAETEKLKRVGEAESATLFMTVLAVFNVMLGKLSSQEDITVGTGVGGRDHADLEGIMGMFVNIIALRNQPRRDLPFRAFLAEVKAGALAGFDHQSYPYEQLIGDLGIPRDPSRSPLFDVTFVYQNFEQHALRLPGLTLRPYPNEHHVSKFDLSLMAGEVGGALHLEFEYATDLFSPQTIERFATYFRRIAAEVGADPGRPIARIPMLSDWEQEQLLVHFNDTDGERSPHASVIDQFEKQARRNPSLPAVRCGREAVTYAELNNMANCIAGELVRSGVSAHQRVAVVLPPSVEMVASVLAVLKVGGVYVPLSPDTPPARIAYMLGNSDAAFYLTSAEMALGTMPAQRLDLERLGYTAEVTYPRYPREAFVPDWLYVIYTSGSTGTPKGVPITHAGLLNSALFYANLYGLREGVAVSQVLNPAFDAAALEMWPALLNGCCLRIAPLEVRLDPAAMFRWLVDDAVAVTIQVPAIAEGLLKQDWDRAAGSLRGMTIGGDRLNYFPPAALPFKVYNMYGPTEDAVVTTYAEVTPGGNGDKYLIGKPIPNKQVYVLDAAGDLRPIGAPGELCIGGAGIAPGYLNNPALTAEKFVPNPYKPGTFLYRTGDAARWLADGVIEFLGRIDNQVKLRGYRIELGEIEAQLSRLPGVREAVVVIRGEAHKYLAAYYVADGTLPAAELRNPLAVHLPEYMVPTRYVQLAALPLTPNGKVDKKALPEPGWTPDEAYVAPAGETQSRLVAIWSQVLEMDKAGISVNKNFFELGGNSLKLLDLKHRVERELDLNASVLDLFRYATISSFVEFTRLGAAGNETREAALDEEVFLMEGFINNLQ